MPLNFYFLTTLLTLVVNFTLSAQREVAILKAPFATTAQDPGDAANDAITFPFLLDRNQILLKASVEDRMGYFMLDTGAPTLLINNQRRPSDQRMSGLSSGGAVELQKHRIKSFSFAGVEQGGQDAYLLDLTSFEKRSGHQLLGMIGYKQLRNFELLIDCAKQEMCLFPAGDNALHASAEPAFSVSFVYDDHLPVITLRNGGKKLRFAIDTGAGVNLINQKAGNKKLGKLRVLDDVINVEGLDGQAANHHYAKLPDLEMEGRSIGTTDFVLSDLSHLQVPGKRAIDGIIGPDFLKHYRISIDFKKRKIHFW